MQGMDLIRSKRGLSAKIARELKLSTGAVAQWDKVPAERIPEIERITGISRQLLRPDICLPSAPPDAETV
jgi:DNA-binding transcriptional regulator YdaS (Cro superfamily)